jgi:tRNA pseudouridine38-40 synthase
MSVEYNGAAYSGWQRQPNAITVEEKIEDALERILGTPIDIIGQGRTDSGVHAEGQAAHFDVAEALDCDALQYGLLGVLPKNIAVWELQQVPDDFHARFDATSRQYRYQIVRRPRPLLKDTSILVLQDLDLKAVRYCVELVKGTNNFDSFTKPDNQNPSSTCEVMQSNLIRQDDLWIYRIEANRFVRHLVRRLVGTMLEVGKGKRSVDEFEDMIQQPSKNKHGHGAAAKGLVLEKVRYKKD